MTVYLLCLGVHPYVPIAVFASEQAAREAIARDPFADRVIVPATLGESIEWDRAIVVKGTYGTAWLRN